MTQGRKTQAGTLVGYFTEQEQGQKSLLELYHRGFRRTALVHKTADRDVQTCDLFPWRSALGAIVTAHAHRSVRNAACATVANELQAEVRQSSVLDSDETGARVDGRTWWEWVFVTASVVLHVIRPSRAVNVIEDFMGPAWVGTWVSDCWKPQHNVPADRFQLCLAHQIRNLQGLRERAPHLQWARELQALFREAIHQAKRRLGLSGPGFARRVINIERRLDRLLTRPLTTVGRAGTGQALPQTSGAFARLSA